MILLALLQAVAIPAPAATVPVATTQARSTPPAERFSILAEPCGRASGETVGNDVVVCGRDANVQRLPLPDDRGPPDHAVPINPYMRADVALAAEGTPCAATQRGCTVGIGGPLVAAAAKGLFTAITDGVADAKVRKARRADAGKRIAIPLD